jgi:hypothetical protein
MDLVPLSITELELILWLEERCDGAPPVVHGELDGTVHHLNRN